MLTLTGFADEISPDLHVQIEVLESEDIRFIELRGVWGKNVLQLSDQELSSLKEELLRKEIQLSSIGSPIGKINILDDFDEHLIQFDRALFAADYFHAKYIRIFSFFIPDGHNPDAYRDEVISRLSVLVKKAEQSGIVLLHENEKEIYGDNAIRCLDILETINSPYLRMAFDPANFVQCGVKPYSEAYPLLKSYVEYVHIKDALFESGKVVPAGKGDGEVRELLQTLKTSGYDGFLSLEPHLAAAETFSGFSGPDLFKVAAKALKDLLQETESKWK
ncbi:sugar phosphate isomerase/epimerase [Bacillus sp. CMF21]|uniref:sugar phosphate isomerase/epimerase family protein n=1 Tax=Metabacillus dongyingensis TaxID=2874282 RepID=UPI001CBDC73E|nr:sugar phosphate isomerase/epimerase family protein [Metabacillus dongyingensis]UAL53812.1 sugar phosphate isomerase/epimerase [Metabacillus dongyingensis]USK30124.1 sugar phosphate isomerase/epimerase [Bacillus sp. CMF21]